MGSCLSFSKENVVQEAADSVPMEESKTNMSNHYSIHYPKHEPRKNSSLYNKTHKQMKDIPCFICNKNGIETHHYFIEWAATNAIDWSKFGEASKYLYNPQTGVNINQFDWQEVSKTPEIFIDSHHNMITLCKEHHRSGRRGIHHVPYPDWILQKFSVDNFTFLE